MISVTYTPGAPEHVPGTLTLELSEEAALYTAGVLGAARPGLADPPLAHDESPYAALYYELIRNVPDAALRITRHLVAQRDRP